MAHGREEKEKEKEDKTGAIIGVIVVGVVVLGFGSAVGDELWKNRAHPASDLASFTGKEKLKLDHKGMDGTFARFDVVANATYAESLAKIWASNAELVRIRVTECQRGGLVDVSEDEKSNEVRYEFAALGSGGGHASEGHASDSHKSDPSASYESLRLTFAEGKLIAKGGSESPYGHAPPTFGCSMSKLGDVIATSNMAVYSLDLRNRSVRVGKDSSGSSIYKDLWRWEASGSGGTGSINVCDATCTAEGSPDCPTR